MRMHWKFRYVEEKPEPSRGESELDWLHCVWSLAFVADASGDYGLDCNVRIEYSGTLDMSGVAFTDSNLSLAEHVLRFSTPSIGQPFTTIINLYNPPPSLRTYTGAFSSAPGVYYSGNIVLLRHSVVMRYFCRQARLTRTLCSDSPQPISLVTYGREAGSYNLMELASLAWG